ncbi:MAG TPA: response regulator [Pirellulales bacterium]|jgi:CheY-like chemotaxis protein/anti-sigma regulatory factor (Ser/Thr protein kinase)|nr:response regulator [Pirellulales bacterium]
MARVLVVDDSAVDRRLAGSLLEKNYNASVDYASDGNEALAHMREHMPDIVVTDLQMPRMNGLDLVTAVRRQYPLVPVVLMTAQGSEDIAVQALKTGAASYLPKSRLAYELLETIDSVLAVARADRDQGKLANCLSESQWDFVLPNDTSMLCPLVDLARQDLMRLGLCDETVRTRMGIALHEAVINAIDHGNLELSSELRERDDVAYQRLAAERRVQAPYKNRKVYVQVKLSRDEARYVVRDEGPGFDPSRLPDPTDPANLEKICGRGLLLVRTFMDEVRHNATGNEITMIKRREP